MKLQEWACIQEDHYAEGLWRRAEGQVVKGKEARAGGPGRPFEGARGDSGQRQV